jgi:uncharacterized protein (TIGR02246 family)
MRALAGLVFVIAATASALAGPMDVTSLSASWAAAWSAKDLDAIMALYAPQPVFLANSGERWTGADEIRTNFAMGLSSFTPQLTLKSVRSEVSGRLAYDSGTYDEIITPQGSTNAAHVWGNYLFVFQRQKNGEWKILEQSFSQFDPGKT